MGDDVGARLDGALEIRAFARQWASFNQDNETLRGNQQPGWFRPPDRPRLT